MPHNALLVGLCTGLWAASAISVAPSLPDLVHIGVQAMILAFKLGTYVQSIAERMSPASNRSESWSRIAIRWDNAEEAKAKLDAFQSEVVSAPIASTSN